MMDGFDTMTMSYYASPPSLGSAAAADYLNALPMMDMQDHHSNFDTETFVGYVDSPDMTSTAVHSNAFSNMQRSSIGAKMLPLDPPLIPIPHSNGTPTTSMIPFKIH